MSLWLLLLTYFVTGISEPLLLLFIMAVCIPVSLLFHCVISECLLLLLLSL